MKKNDVIILSMAIIFSGLFYNQLAGLNCLLFSLLVSATLLYINPEKIKNKNWWYYCMCFILSGVLVFVNNSNLSSMAYIFSALILSSKTYTPMNSTFICLLFSIYSIISSHVFWIIEQLHIHQLNKETEKANKGKRTLSVVLAIIIVTLFFYLYRLANPLFNNFAQSINFEWLSFGWLFFTVLSFFLMGGLFKTRRVESIAVADITARQDISRLDSENEIPTHNTTLIALILFGMLNIMLVFINGLDISNIYINRILPKSITLSDFVHQAVWSTVFSIVIAVSIIAWFFKGALNFNVHGKKVKLLVYFWVLQSAVMVINTMIRNYWYIQEYQLTYLRIGVFVFLMLCLIGLALTYYKVAKHKSTWQLARLNFEIWFFLLIASSIINWDQTITNYNIEHASKTKTLDVLYLINLSDANIPELVKLANDDALNYYESMLLGTKMLNTYKRDRFNQWPSFNLRMQQNQKALIQLKIK